MDNYYEFTGDKIETEDGITLRLIRAAKDIPEIYVSAGRYGGWVQSEMNLKDGAWAGEETRIYGNALVSGAGSQIYDCAEVFGNAKILNGARIGDAAKFAGMLSLIIPGFMAGTEVYDNSYIGEDCLIDGRAKIGGNSQFRGSILEIYGHYHDALIASRDDLIEINEADYFTKFTAHRVKDFSKPFFHWRSGHLNLKELQDEIYYYSTAKWKKTLKDQEILHMLRMIETRVMLWEKLAEAPESSESS